MNKITYEDLRELIVGFLNDSKEPCSALHIAKHVLDLNGTSRDVNRVLMDLEREGYVRHYETNPVTWIIPNKINEVSSKL